MATLTFDEQSVTFKDAGLGGEASSNPTALMFSRSGEPVLFVAQLDGTIKRYVVEKQLDGTFDISTANTPSQTGPASIDITTIKDTVENYDDEGNVATGSQTDERQITGLVTTVEEIDGVEYDVVYVSSSDRRHGGGGSATDQGVDPNSGQINKLVIDKFSGAVVDSYAVLRGLPRSSENHSTNGMDLAVDANGDVIMYVAQGGNTNNGSPSNNFVGFVESPLSGAILKVNLTQLESYDVRTDANGEKFILDLPTLNDPGREDVDLSTLNIQNLSADPLFSMDVGSGTAPEWAGSSDKGSATNSAKITSHVLVSEGGQLKLVENPMSVFQPGYRNQYDVHVLKNGEIVSWDNGPNGGWGGRPVPLVDQGGNQAYVEDWTTELATNDFNESGSSTFGDWLHVAGTVDDAYGPYAGAPNPIRAAVEAIALTFDQSQPLYIDDGTGTLIINPAVYKGATPTTPIYDYDGTTVLFTGQDQALDFLSRLTPHYDEQSDGSWIDVRPDGPGGYKLMPVDLHAVVAGYDWKSPGSSISDPTQHFEGADIAGDTAFSPEAQLLTPGQDGGLIEGGTSSNGLSQYTSSSWFGGALDGAIIGTAFGGSKLQFVQLLDTDGDGRSDAAVEIGTISNFGSQPLSVQALGDDGLSAVLIDNDNDGVDDFSGTIWAATYGADNITTFVPGGTPTDPSVDADGDGIDDTQDTHAWASDNAEGVIIGSFFGPNVGLWHMELSSAALPFGAATNVGPAPDAGIVAAWKNGVDAARDGFLYDGSNFDIGGASSFLSIGTAPTGSAEGTANDQKDALGIGAILSRSLAGATITAEMLNIFDYQINAERNTTGATWDGGEKVGIFLGPDQSTFMHAAIVVQSDGSAKLELYSETGDANGQSQTADLLGVEAPLDVPNQDSVIQIGFGIDLEAQTAVARARYQNPNLDGDPSTADAEWSDWVETAALPISADVLASLYGDYVNFGSESGATIGMFANAPTGDDSFSASWDYVEIVGVQGDGGGPTDGTVLYRWNAGNQGDIAAIDDGPNWVTSTASIVSGSTGTVSTHKIINLDASVPLDTTPLGIFSQERWDEPSGGEFLLSFNATTTGTPIANGDYAVRVFMGDGFAGTAPVGTRVYDMSVEGELVLDDFDSSAVWGSDVGGMVEWIGTVSDGSIDISFQRGVENPQVNAVEIIALGLDDGDATPVVSLVAAPFAESAGTTGVTLETDIPVPADETVTVAWEVRAVAGGATPEIDFTVPGGSFVSHTGDGVYQGQSQIAGGSSDVTIPISIIDDAEVEGDEVFEVVITGVSGAQATIGINTVSVTIGDDDVVPATGQVQYRVNAGGAEVAATDDGPAWAEDQSADSGGLSDANGQAKSGTPSPYLDTSLTDQAFGGSFNGSNTSIAPNAVFVTERYGEIAGSVLGDVVFSYDFPVAVGEYVVNLYFAEVWSGANVPGARVFDVAVEGQVAFDDIDLTDDYGFNAVGVASYLTTVSDGNLDLDFLKGAANNPKVSAIEIIATAPVEPREVTLSIAGAPAVVEAGPDGTTTALPFALTVSDGFTGQMTVGYTSATNGAAAVPGTSLVSFVGGVGTLTVPVANDDVDDGVDAVVVTLTSATDEAADPVDVVLGASAATGTVAEDDAVVVDPADIDGDGILNTDDPFAYDGQNGLGDVLLAGGSFRQDFDVDGDVFGAGGFTGILVNADLDPNGASGTDPYGDRTTEATSIVQAGVLKIESSETDVYGTGTGSKNAIKDNYQRGADVSQVDRFTLETKIQNGWLGTVPQQYSSFGLKIGAGGTDDYVKFVIGAQGSAPRFQLAHENSLGGDIEENKGLSANGIDPFQVASVLLRIEVKKAASPASLTATAIFYDANDVELGTITSDTRTVTGSFAAALDGQNPLTGGTGGIAYGVSITDWGNGDTNRFKGEWDYLELKSPDGNNAPPTVLVTQTAPDVSENADTTASIKVADISVSDDGVGTNDLSLSGNDATSFAIVDGAAGPELHLAAGAALDFETKEQLDVTVDVDDPTVGATPDGSAGFSLAVVDVNEAPSLTLVQTLVDITEDADTSTTIKVADIVIDDDALGENDLTLSGADQSSFTIVDGANGKELHLVANTVLDFAAKATFDIVVEVDDAAVGTTPDDSSALSLAVTPSGQLPNDVASGVAPGDFSGDSNAPTASVLAAGGNTVIAAQEGFGGDRDYVSVTVPEGYVLSGITLAGFDDFDPNIDNAVFVGLASGSAFPFDFDDGAAVDSALLLGGAVVGDSDLVGGTDLLARFADGFVEKGGNAPTQGFDGSLAAGTYTFGFSQNQGPSAITLNLTVEPATTGTPVIGEAVLSVNENMDDIETSNFGNNSFKIANTGDKVIKAIEIDVTDAILPDAVFDPFKLAGDLTGKVLTINTEGGTGVVTPQGGFSEGAIGVTYFGEGGVKGYEKIRLEFTEFDPGETIGFSIDMDPNSIAGAEKGTLDGAALITDKPGDDTWDVGGIGGAELIHSLFTVSYEDDTTSQGRLQGQGAGQQIGAKALSTQATNDKEVLLFVNDLGSGGVGVYSDGGPTVTVQGEAGETARVVLAKGFTVPFTNPFDGAYGAQFDAQMAELASSRFPANNIAEFQYVDVALDGTVQDITGLFDFTDVDAFTIPSQYDDEAKLPLGFAASVIDTSTDLSKGPVTVPIHLTHSDGQLPVLSLTAPADATETGDTGTVPMVFTLGISDPNFVGTVNVVYAETVDELSTTKTATLDFSAGLPAITVDVPNDDVAGADHAISVALVSTTSNELTISTAAATAIVADDDGGLVEGDVVLRINAFGPELANTDGGPNWVVDAPFYSAIDDRGDTLLSATAGASGAPDALFQESRSADSTMNYDIDAAAHLSGNGFYKVKLFFTEPHFGGSGARVFDTAIEGVVFDNLDNLDPAALTAKGVGFVVENVVEVADGVLDIDPLSGAESGAGGKQNPVISGIEIVEMVPAGVAIASISPSEIFTVYAGGEAAQGNLPSFKVLENGLLVGEATVTNAVEDAPFAGDYDAFVFNVSAGATLADLQIVYDSDVLLALSGVGNDTNLFIDKVALRGVDYEEDSWIFTADDRTLASFDGAREDLRVNGLLEFGPIG